MEAASHNAMLETCRCGSITEGVNKTLAKQIRYHLPQYLAQGKILFYKKNVDGGTTMLQVPKQSELPRILELYHLAGGTLCCKTNALQVARVIPLNRDGAGRDLFYQSMRDLSREEDVFQGM